MVPLIGQAVRLWSQLTGREPVGLDQTGRIRLDGWELDDRVQANVARGFHSATTETVEQVADLDWFRAAYRAAVYGFDVPGVDYGAEADIDVPWPQLHAAAV
jgi:enoyl-[acyl-carrier protein] reductase/trans-2-enoyl-CoA reductase (NAD+)